MSSFLDSTGLSRVISKITDYFAKKDGTYPDMTVGNYTSTGTIKTALDGKASSSVYSQFYAPTIATSGSGSWVHVCDVSGGSGGYSSSPIEIDLFVRPRDLYKITVRLNHTGSFGISTILCNRLVSTDVLGVVITSSQLQIWVNVGSDSGNPPGYRLQYCATGATPTVTTNGARQSSAPTGLAQISIHYPISNGGVGSASQPVYVDANGQIQVCSSNMQGVESVYYTNLTSNWSRIATVTITETDLVAFSADISETDYGYLSLHIEFRLRKISHVMRLSATVTNMSFNSNANNTVSVGYIANGNDYSIYLKIGTTQYTGLAGRIRLRYAQGIGWQRALFTTNVANMTGSENLTAGIVRTVSVS